MTSVAVLMGGISREREVSTWSGEQMLGALGDRGVGVRIDERGGWRVGEGPTQDFGAALLEIRTRCQVVLIGLHGRFGEDGTVQALLEAAGLPYAGSRVAASALALDKSRTKFAYQARGLSTPVFAPRWRGRSDEEVLAEAIAFGGPWVVKANGEGSSFGVHLADDAEAVRAALAVLEGEALVERRIRGREFTCGILEALDGTAKPLPVTEMITEATARFFDFEAKYSGRTQEVTPAEISEDLRDRIQALALEAHRVLGCRHLSRTDVMQDETGALHLLETNTLPGMTKGSLVPQAAAAAGMSFPALVDRLVQLALDS